MPSLTVLSRQTERLYSVNSTGGIMETDYSSAGSDERKLTLGRAAMFLAMSEDRESEEDYRNRFLKLHYKSVATEVSGPLLETQQKIIKNAVTAALNTRIIENNQRSIHSIIHTVLEALQGIVVVPVAPNPSIKVKIALVTDGEWVACGIFGLSALHHFSNHERAGLGIMHL